MEIKLKYPAFVFRKKDNMVYVFYNDNQMKTTNIEIFHKTNFEGRTIIDSSGMKYITKSAYISRYWKFWETLFLKGKTISFEYDYEGFFISLSELKAIIMSKYPKSRWFSSAWSEIEEFKKEMDKCTTFEQVAQIVSGSLTSKN